MLKKNDLIQLKITSATAEGSGVGRTEDGLAVFVPMSAIGDELTVRILKVKKTYAFTCERPFSQVAQMEQGVTLEDGYVTLPCKVTMVLNSPSWK